MLVKLHPIEKINSWLIVALFFFLSISTALGSLLSALIFILWLIHANFKNQFSQIRSNKVVIASLLFFCLHLVGLLWTNDILSGVEEVKKNWKFLMIPIFMFYVRKEHISLYINAFLAAILLTVVLSFSIWFEIIEPILKAGRDNPSVFMSHTVHNPLLVIAIYIVASRIIFDKPKSLNLFIFEIFFLFSMIINLFITGGRTGHIIFFIAIFILSFQYFKKDIFKVFIFSLILSISVFSIAYSFSGLFKYRVMLTIDKVLNYEEDRNDSVGARISFFSNGMDVIADNPFLGVGTGDLKIEMQKYHRINTPEVLAPDDPHNSHLGVLLRLGLLGLLPFYWIFYNQLKSCKNIKNKELSRIGFAIPILFFIASFGASYMTIHVTSLLFCVLSAVIFASYDHKQT